jgi:ADP-ribose pyrophosphatase YjhB (NUDIX family)
MENERKVIPGIHLLFRRYNEVLGQNEYLIHKRVNTKFFDDHFSVPGGHIDNYETPAECAIREADEELTVKIDQSDLTLANVIYRVKRDVNEHRIDFCYVVNKWEGEIRAAEPEKHTDPEWYPVDQLPQPMVPYVEKAIKDIENQTIFTQTEI